MNYVIKSTKKEKQTLSKDSCGYFLLSDLSFKINIIFACLSDIRLIAVFTIFV